MQRMKFFIDTHDAANGTFPQASPRSNSPHFTQNTRRLAARRRISLRVHAGFADGRAYCFTMAPDADAVRRAHERVGLRFDSITEVVTSTPGDLFFAAAA